MSRFVVEEREIWRRWVTPKPLMAKPVHRWYVFPHSFSSELVDALIDEWGLGPGDHILDPFAGAGTTLLAAKEKGVPATGYDLSPLAVMASRVKVANYDLKRLRAQWDRLSKRLEPNKWNGAEREYPELVRKALPGKLLGAYEGTLRSIAEMDASETERDLFRLAVLTTVPRFSRAVATGGWLKWVRKSSRVTALTSQIASRVEGMLHDLQEARLPRRALWQVKEADARALPDAEGTYSAVITSPPYPNRHDYTRVFGVELMLAFLDWEDTRRLRYQSFHSHPEARPERPGAHSYTLPGQLGDVLKRIEKKSQDPRVPRMIEGYFLDMYLCLREVARVCKSGGRIAFVVGNAQYCGMPVLVDELTAEIGEQVGLRCEKLIAVRYRGNSAQQMGAYGRKPSRESVVVLGKSK